MTIELDESPPVPLRARPNVRAIGLVAVVAVVAGALGGLVASRASASPNPARHVVEFVIEGDDYAAVDHVSVDGKPAETGRPLMAGSFAVITVRSPDNGAAACSIIVDGQHAASARGAYGQSATCVWAVR